MNYKKSLTEIFEKYLDNIEDDLKIRWNWWQKDVTCPEQYEVIGGLLARQINIAMKFISCSNIWDGHIGPIILRSMVDNYINFAWVFEEPIERARKFIYYGLGQEKLMLEHRKEELKTREHEDKEDLIIEASEAWINRQRFSFLTEVSLKSWSETPVRKMAEEANCLDLYNYVYQPFSCAAHNMWNHVAKYNLLESDNPLHKFFRRPIIIDAPPDIHYAELAAKYVNKMMSLFDKKTGFKPERNSYSLLLQDIARLAEKIAEQEQESNNKTDI